MRQLTKLSQPFPDAYVEKAPKGKYGSFVAHHVINQALLATVGPFDFRCVQIIRSYVPPRVDKESGEVKKSEINDAVTGVIARLTVEIDGRTVSIEEAGDCEDPQNWNTDGARLKDAMSDALKRCAMRLGLGIHLWAQEHFFLHDSLLAKEQEDGTTAEQSTQTTDTGEASSAAPHSVGAPAGGTKPPLPEPVPSVGQHKSTKQRQLAHIHVLGEQLGLDHEAVKSLAIEKNLLPEFSSMSEMTGKERAQFLALLTAMQQEAASA